MKIAEVQKGDKTIEALAKRLLKDFHANGSPSELAATLLRLNPHLGQIKHLAVGTPILLPQGLGSPDASAGPLAGIAGVLVQQARAALHEIQTAMEESAVQAREEAKQAQAWLKSDQAKQILREHPDLKAEFSKTVTAAGKVRNEEGNLLAGQEKSLKKLEADLANLQKARPPITG
jgi:hypothetical protein